MKTKPNLPFTTKEVDGLEWFDEINTLHREGFADKDYPRDYMDESHWWLVFDASDETVAMAGLRPSVGAKDGYLIRAAVSASARGQGLQRHLIRKRIAAAKRMGLTTVVTDTHSNIHSANNLIREGFKLWTPATPWTDSDTALYWRKEI